MFGGKQQARTRWEKRLNSMLNGELTAEREKFDEGVICCRVRRNVGRSANSGSEYRKAGEVQRARVWQ